MPRTIKGNIKIYMRVYSYWQFGPFISLTTLVIDARDRNRARVCVITGRRHEHSLCIYCAVRREAVLLFICLEGHRSASILFMAGLFVYWERVRLWVHLRFFCVYGCLFMGEKFVCLCVCLGNFLIRFSFSLFQVRISAL